MTSLEVARRAGVSQSAVSLVLAGKSAGRVAKRTERAIWKAARQLDYRPNAAARMLRLGRSRLLVLAVPDIDNPYFAACLEGAEREARKHGFAVVLATVREKSDWQPVILDPLLSGSVDGFVLFSMHPPAARERRALRGKAVLVDESATGFPSVALDIEGGMRAGIEHLVELGHTKIGHLAARIPAETFAARRKTYLDVMRRANFATREVDADFSIRGAHEAVLKLLDNPERPSAMVCDSDVLAAGVYKAARELGLRVPADLSVLGIDDSFIAQVLDPELTTVAIPAATVGERAIRLLLQVLRKSVLANQDAVPLSLVVRASTARQGVSSWPIYH